MNILVISDAYPMPDRASGDLRFFTMLRFLAQQHAIHYFAFQQDEQMRRLGESAVRSYQRSLSEIGVDLVVKDPLPILKGNRFDVVFFEFYSAARSFMAMCRYYEPGARMVVDSVDVHFGRFESKARLTGNPIDTEIAKATKHRELAAYRSSDAVVAVTENDKSLLLKEVPAMHVEIIPNMHSMGPEPNHEGRKPGSMVFVGGFNHEPNVDAMLYFCHEVMPIIRKCLPCASLTILGSHIPREVLALAGNGVEVLGFVPDTAPFLDSATISIAPLRFGGGMKGKVGEAMSRGLPVVTTEVGIEGFRLTPGEDVLVGNTPTEFAQRVVCLLEDADIRKKIGLAGREFIRSHYSEPIGQQQVLTAFDRLASLPITPLSLAQRLTMKSRKFLETRVLWRLKQ
ncbi:MAG: glycosyltransferase family 4 protein [Thiobacillaceae bacterium]